MSDYIILGIIQGIFEWIPISSQGTVALVSQLLVMDFRPIEVALFLHLGTFLATLVYFRKEWLEVIRLKDIVLFRFLLVSAIVSGIVGLIFYYLIRDMAIGNSLLVLTGFGLLFTAYFHRSKKISTISFNKLAIISGALQGLAVIPGFSRSGATIFGLSFGNFKPKEILKISYMMSVPAVLGMSVFLFFENPNLILAVWPALIFSFLIGLLTLNFLLKFSAKINFFKFALIFALLCFLGVGLSVLI